jgi:hypothetical protein
VRGVTGKNILLYAPTATKAANSSRAPLLPRACGPLRETHRKGYRCSEGPGTEPAREAIRGDSIYTVHGELLVQPPSGRSDSPTPIWTAGSRA